MRAGLIRRRCSWRLPATAAVLAAVTLLPGCGGGGTKTVTVTTTTPRPAALLQQQLGHPCTPSNWTMACTLRQLPPPLRSAPPAPVVAYGIDFAWSCPSPAGRGFGASYHSYDSTKNWSGVCWHGWQASGAKTVGVWETTATRAGQGYSAGRSDALAAAKQAAALGNTTRPIFFAVDYDAAGSSIAPYFQGAQSVLHARVSAYGGYNQVGYLCQHGLVNHTNWQTYAWSGGRWLPASCAPLEQYLNSSAVDYDRAIAADYGQSPGPKPLPPPDPYRRLPKVKRHFAHGVVAAEYNTVKTWKTRRCVNPVRRSVCKSTRAHLVLLGGRIWYVAHHRLVKGHWVGRTKASWGDGRGWRFHVIWTEEHQRRATCRTCLP